MPYGSYLTLRKRFNETVRGVAADTGVVVVDLERLVPREPQYFDDSLTHLSAIKKPVQYQLNHMAIAPIVKDEDLRQPGVIIAILQF